MKRFISTIFAIFLILLFFAPIPGASIFLVFGLSILICSSLPFALWLQRQRVKYERVNKGFIYLEEKLSRRWTENLLTTRPGADPRAYFSKETANKDSNVVEEKHE